MRLLCRNICDVYDWQKKDGKLPQIAPYGGVDFYMSFMNGSVGWSDAGVLIPYRFWKHYGDDSLIRHHYDGMVRYAKFMITEKLKAANQMERVARMNNIRSRAAEIVEGDLIYSSK